MRTPQVVGHMLCCQTLQRKPQRFAFGHFKCTVAEKTINVHILVIVTPSHTVMTVQKYCFKINKKELTQAIKMLPQKAKLSRKKF